MRAVVPCHVLGVDEAEVRLVDQGGCLEAVSRMLPGRVPPRDVVELSMYERNQLLEGMVIALAPSEQQAGDFSLGGFRNVQRFSACPTVQVPSTRFRFFGEKQK